MKSVSKITRKDTFQTSHGSIAKVLKILFSDGNSSDNSNCQRYALEGIFSEMRYYSFLSTTMGESK